ncbi:hypothetical protein GNI_171080 [Gregarina niphandrodes]|uniref:Uncharacterized protein n=1 Tax=Gregarina niphandrodes TaxID=110365 RepID=A0A023AXT6_GRENI|nr:hypothetical protein GNI_171080 [Gregarina niphandrodes]EZG43466.1 hypothetical protein GNI_171080 [Gregarina niphandrodes]|eukprot:XP_011133317.1 hypothetical protein GNI_171080 [Gregarina niphandrodes]
MKQGTGRSSCVFTRCSLAELWFTMTARATSTGVTQSFDEVELSLHGDNEELIPWALCRASQFHHSLGPVLIRQSSYKNALTCETDWCNNTFVACVAERLSDKATVETACRLRDRITDEYKQQIQKYKNIILSLQSNPQLQKNLQNKSVQEGDELSDKDDAKKDDAKKDDAKKDDEPSSKDDAKRDDELAEKDGAKKDDELAKKDDEPAKKDDEPAKKDDEEQSEEEKSKDLIVELQTKIEELEDLVVSSREKCEDLSASDLKMAYRLYQYQIDLGTVLGYLNLKSDELKEAFDKKLEEVEDDVAEDNTFKSDEENSKQKIVSLYSTVKWSLDDMIAVGVAKKMVERLMDKTEVEAAAADDKPVEADAKAAESDAKPVESGAKPVESDAKPVESDAKPVESDAKPVESGAISASAENVAGSECGGKDDVKDDAEDIVYVRYDFQGRAKTANLPVPQFNIYKWFHAWKNGSVMAMDSYGRISAERFKELHDKFQESQGTLLPTMSYGVWSVDYPTFTRALQESRAALRNGQQHPLTKITKHQTISNSPNDHKFQMYAASLIRQDKAAADIGEDERQQNDSKEVEEYKKRKAESDE